LAFLAFIRRSRDLFSFVFPQYGVIWAFEDRLGGERTDAVGTNGALAGCAASSAEAASSARSFFFRRDVGFPDFVLHR